MATETTTTALPTITEVTYGIDGNVIADYSDMSGHYRIERNGDYLITLIGDDLATAEAFAHRIERAPIFDDQMHPDRELTETFGSDDDLDPDGGVVWINGEAFSTEWADEVVVIFGGAR